jgi:hypothetical protein
MMVCLSSELFEPPTEDLSLLGLFEHGWHGEHRVDVDLAHPAVSAWLAGQERSVREQCELSVGASAHEEALQPTAVTVTVVVGKSSDWSCSPPRLCLQDARALLRQPFEIYVEDGSSDRAFLRKMMTQDELGLIDELELADRLRFVHGGGSRLKMQVEQRAKDPRSKLQTWVLFDSDALTPGKPSTYSDDICEICRASSIPFYRLSRRFIESYLPLDALQRWGLENREQDLPAVRAFKRMRSSQRHHYNMKEGFAKDRPRQAEAGSLYDDVPPRDRERLEHGFGKKIGMLFQDRYPGNKKQLHSSQFVLERELRRDGGWEELRPAIRELLAHMGVSA